MLYYKQRPIMELCHDRKALSEIYATGGAPKVDRLAGTGRMVEWGVTMLTGVVPNLGRYPFQHRKRFSYQGGKVVGCNVLCGREWGWFRVSDDLGFLTFDYDVSCNGRLVSRIADHVRSTSDGDVLVGRFNLKWRGKLKFVGYFSLVRLGG